MKKKQRADKNYKFSGKKHSGPGTAALVFSFVPLALFFYAVSVSYLRGGQAPAKIGCIGIAAVLSALWTLRISVREARKENIRKKVPVTGAVLSVLMLAGWTAVYVIGWIGL
ncbi:MAG: hypothetical protein K2N87_12125 [Eubacterium sp.]|nr:hypothetical protein [Eubacterium sp.]